MELISVVLNCPPMFERSKTLLEECFDNYSLYKLLESDNIIDFIPIEKSDVLCSVHIKRDIILPLTEKEKESVKIRFDMPETLISGVKNDEEIGAVKIYCENNLIFTQKIYTILG